MNYIYLKLLNLHILLLNILLAHNVTISQPFLKQIILFTFLSLFNPPMTLFKGFFDQSFQSSLNTIKRICSHCTHPTQTYYTIPSYNPNLLFLILPSKHSLTITPTLNLPGHSYSYSASLSYHSFSANEGHWTCELLHQNQLFQISDSIVTLIKVPSNCCSLH